MTQKPVTESNIVDALTGDEEPPSSSSVSRIEVELVVDDGITLTVDRARVQQSVQAAAAHRGFHDGTIGIRITDDSAIRVLNATHLGHDYATDVISFGYSAKAPMIEGELVVSIDTATRQASEIGWPAAHELLLYIVHGTLHITGMDDHDADDRAAMRTAEAIVMTQLGIDQIHRFGADQVDLEDHTPVDGDQS